MSAPRTKRQFAGAASDPAQRQITSFFTSRAAGAPAADPTQQGPSLPANVQTNLLNVGMRVRKSVPEGYKTGTYSSFKLWSDADNRPVSSASTSPAPSSRTTSQRELLPFCGINRVGGLSPQPYIPEEEVDAAMDVPGLDDIPGLSSSQESVESNTSSAAAPSRKRIFHDGEEVDDVRFWQQEQERGDVSPRSLAPVGWGNARVMAVPKKLGRRKTTAGGATRGFEQENVVVANDFEDADFLVTDGMDLSDA